MIDIFALRASTDLVALISSRVKLTKRGKDWYGQCPFHSGDRTPSFSVVPAKHFFHCHGCGAHGDALDFVMRTEGLSLIEAARRLGGADASPEAKRRLDRERRDRESASRLAAKREAEEIATAWEATNWMVAWGTWLRNMNIDPPPFA